MSNSTVSTVVSIAPFVLLLLLWYFLIKKVSKGGTSYYSKSIRQSVRDELAPELKALRESIDALRRDLNDRR